MAESPMKLPEHYPEVLADLAEQLYIQLDEIISMKKPQSLEELEHVVFEVAEHIRHHWAGQLIYFQKGKDYEISKRDLEIWNKRNAGVSHQDLVREYGLSIQTIYAIDKKVTRAQRAKRQRDIFELPPETD